MRHSLAQLLSSSAPPGSGSPREPAAACSFPSEASSSRSSGRESPGGVAREAEPRHDALDDPELFFPPGLELDDWLEAAMAAETRPDWEIGGGQEEGGGGVAATEEGGERPSPRPRPPRPGSNRLRAAAAARLNRQKKKQYVQGLECRLQNLAAENRQLRDRNRGLCRRLRDLERETSYLRAVLANQSAVGRLLSRLAAGGEGRAGLRISSSLFGDQEPARAPEARFPSESSNSGSSDHDYALPVPEEEDEEEDKKAVLSPSPGGICLHVDRDQVSVEFCSVCARRAAGSALAATSAASSFASKMCLPCQAPLCRG